VRGVLSGAPFVLEAGGLPNSFPTSDLVRFDEFLDVARDKPDEPPDFHERDCPCFNPVI
jgi:hypothetical protein